MAMVDSYADRSVRIQHIDDVIFDSGTFGLVEDFVRKYFDSNPISYLGIIVTYGGKAERLTELSGNRSSHIQALRAYKDSPKGKRPTEGPPSLQNALSKCKASFMETAGQWHRRLIHFVC